MTRRLSGLIRASTRITRARSSLISSIDFAGAMIVLRRSNSVGCRLWLDIWFTGIPFAKRLLLRPAHIPQEVSDRLRELISSDGRQTVERPLQPRAPGQLAILLRGTQWRNTHYDRHRQIAAHLHLGVKGAIASI